MGTSLLVLIVNEIKALLPNLQCDYLLTITDRLGSDLHFVPTTKNVTAEKLAVLFFDNWYCENGLPREIISDRDKLFISKFWKHLMLLTRIKSKMSTAYHPHVGRLKSDMSQIPIMAL